MSWTKAQAAAYYVRNRARIRRQQAQRYKGLTKKAKQAQNVRQAANYYTRRAREPWENLLGKARGRAKEKGLPCNLTKAWLAARWTGRCELTNLPFDVASGRPTPMSASVDRIKPELGYVEENCRLVLYCVNSFKSTMSDVQMRKVARRLI